MPPALPDSLARLLSLLRPAFTAPSFDTFCWLVHGFIGRIGEHTITGIWQAARLAGVLHHSRAHDFFARRRWSADRLGLLLAAFIVERFLDDGGPIMVALDDTLFSRSGRCVFAASWHFDEDRKAPRSVRFGNAFVCLGILVRLPRLGQRTVCLPVLFRLWRPPAAGREHQTKVELGHELVRLLAARFPGRQLQVAADSYYATKALARLPENAHALVRLRHNAALYEPPPPRPAGRAGRPRKRGPRLPTPAQLLAQGPQCALELRPAGTRRRLQAVTIDCLWSPTLGERPVRVVIAREPSRPKRDLLMVLSTDTTLDAAQILTGYLARWAIEVAFQQAKGQLGVGQARNRTPKAVARTVPFGFLCQTLTLIWYALYGQPTHDLARHRRTAPWYLHKRSPSFADMLIALRRELIVAEYRAQQPTRPLSAKTKPHRQAPHAQAS